MIMCVDLQFWLWEYLNVNIYIFFSLLLGGVFLGLLKFLHFEWNVMIFIDINWIAYILVLIMHWNEIFYIWNLVSFPVIVFFFVFGPLLYFQRQKVFALSKDTCIANASEEVFWTKKKKKTPTDARVALKCWQSKNVLLVYSYFKLTLAIRLLAAVVARRMNIYRMELSLLPLISFFHFFFFWNDNKKKN